MHLAVSKQQIKSAMLPIAIIGGVVFYKWMGYVSFLSPYLIFVMLFVTYCKLDFKDFRPHKAHVFLLAIQMAFAAVAYLLLSPFNHTVAEGVFICIFMPTATAAPVITSMLGGSISFVATFSLLCNTFVALAGPVILAAIGDNTDITLWQSTLLILKKVTPLLIGPIAAALILRKATPKVHDFFIRRQQISFYLWAVALLIVVGNCVSFVINTWDERNIVEIAALAAGSFAACILQFVFGRKAGAKIAADVNASQSAGADASDYRVSCAQSLMQKNTVLGVWLAMSYMTPLASVGPAAYIAWHNLVNSWQLFRFESQKHNHKDSHR